MARVTEIEYETTEKEVQKWECDHCSVVVDEDGITTVGLFSGGVGSSTQLFKSDESKHLCEDCIGLRHALRVREKEEYLKARWEGLKKRGVSGINVLLPILTAAFTGLALIIGGFIEDGEGVAGYVVIEVIMGSVLAAFLLLVGSLVAAVLLEKT